MQLNSRDNRLGKFLKALREKYRYGGDEHAERKLKELDVILDDRDGDVERARKRDELLSGLQISVYIDENVVIGENIIGPLISRMGSVSVISDETVLPLVRDYLGRSGKIYTMDSVDGSVLKNIIAEVGMSESPNIIGIGGGRVMDYAKFIMMKTGKFCSAIPTSLATHVYTSPKTHVLPSIAELGVKKTIDGPVPDIAAIDIAFLSKLQEDNPRLIRAGLGDLMACITGVIDWKLAEEAKTTEINHAAAEMAGVIVDTIAGIDVDKPISEWIEDYIFAQTLLCRVSGWAGSAPVSGAEHLFALAAEEGFSEPPLHGELVALGTILATYMQGKDHNKVQQLVKKLKLPHSLSEIGLSIEQTKEALFNTRKISEKKGRHTVINRLDMNRDYCSSVVENLLSEGVIVK